MEGGRKNYNIFSSLSDICYTFLKSKRLIENRTAHFKMFRIVFVFFFFFLVYVMFPFIL